MIRLEKDLPALQLQLQQAEAGSGQKISIEAELNTCREQVAALTAENRSLKTGMDELQERIDRLSSAEGATCPLCGQALSPEHRDSTLEELQAQGKSLGDTYRANQAALKELAGRIPRWRSRCLTLPPWRRSACAWLPRLPTWRVACRDCAPGAGMAGKRGSAPAGGGAHPGIR